MSNKPSNNLIEQALQNGVEDRSYNTVRNGRVASYRGSAIVVDEQGKLFMAVGCGPKGSPSFLDSEGYIKILPMEVTPDNLVELVGRRNEILATIEKLQEMVAKTASNKYILDLHAIIEDLRKAYYATKKLIEQ